jgi:hypothetical protein
MKEVSDKQTGRSAISFEERGIAESTSKAIGYRAFGMIVLHVAQIELDVVHGRLHLHVSETNTLPIPS